MTIPHDGELRVWTSFRDDPVTQKLFFETLLSPKYRVSTKLLRHLSKTCDMTVDEAREHVSTMMVRQCEYFHSEDLKGRTG